MVVGLGSNTSLSRVQRTSVQIARAWVFVLGDSMRESHNLKENGKKCRSPKGYQELTQVELQTFVKKVGPPLAWPPGHPAERRVWPRPPGPLRGQGRSTLVILKTVFDNLPFSMAESMTAF